MNDSMQKLKELKKLNPRSDWKQKNRDFLHSYAVNRAPESTTLTVTEYFFACASLVRQRVLQPAVVMLLVLGVFMGSSLTVVAAFNSRPGDTLYRAKIALEKTQVAISSSERKPELQASLVKKRVEEIQGIVAREDIQPEQRKQTISVAVNEFKKNVEAVKEHVDRVNLKKEQQEPVSAQDKDQTLRIALSVSSEIEHVDQLLAGLSDEDKAELQTTLQEAEEIAAQVVDSANKLNEEDITENTEEEVITEDGSVLGESTTDEQDITESVDEEEDTSEPIVEESDSTTTDEELTEAQSADDAAEIETEENQTTGDLGVTE